jgi:hypothetical protein
MATKELFGDIFINAFEAGTRWRANANETKRIMQDREDRKEAKEAGANAAKEIRAVDAQWEEFQARRKVYQDNVLYQRQQPDKKQEDLFEIEDIALRSEMAGQKLDIAQNMVATYPHNARITEAYQDLAQNQVTVLDGLNRHMQQRRIEAENAREAGRNIEDREDTQSHGINMELFDAANTREQSTHAANEQIRVAEAQDRLKRERVASGVSPGYGDKAKASPMKPDEIQAMLAKADEFGFGQAGALSPDALAAIKQELDLESDEDARQAAAAAFAVDNLVTSGAPENVVTEYKTRFADQPFILGKQGREQKRPTMSPERKELTARQEQIDQYEARLADIKDPELRAHTAEWTKKKRAEVKDELVKLDAEESDFDKEVSQATDYKWLKFTKKWNMVMPAMRLGY